MDLTGRVIALLPEQRFNGRNGEVVRNGFVVETGGQYPRKCSFSVLGEERWKGFSVSVGDSVQVFFDINAREWQGKWFNELTAYRVQRISPAGGNMPSEPAPAPAAEAHTPSIGTDIGDVPF